MKELLNYRYYVLLAIVGAATILLFAGFDGNTGDWVKFQLSAKGVALLLFFVAFKLIDYWNPRGKVDAFARIQRLTKKIIDND